MDIIYQHQETFGTILLILYKKMVTLTFTVMYEIGTNYK